MGLVKLIIMVGFLSAFIISLNIKTNKRLGKWILALAIISSLTACSNEEPEVKTLEEPVIGEEVEEVKEEPEIPEEKEVEKAPEQPINETEDVSIKDDEQLKEYAQTYFMVTAKDSFEGQFDIEAKEESDVFFVTMYPKDNTEDAITYLMLYSNNEDIVNAWQFATQGILSMSESYYDTTGQNISINIVNPANHDNYIYTTFNGIEMYNVIDDLR